MCSSTNMTHKIKLLNNFFVSFVLYMYTMELNFFLPLDKI